MQIRRYDIIYQMTDDLQGGAGGHAQARKARKRVGRALVQQVFHISRIGTVAGCRVLAGVSSAKPVRLTAKAA